MGVIPVLLKSSDGIKTRGKRLQSVRKRKQFPFDSGKIRLSMDNGYY